MSGARRQLEFVQYGNAEGRLVVYFHGVPGGVEECAVFDTHAKAHGLKIICFDRLAIDPSMDREAYYQFLADQIKLQAGRDPVDAIGFSIGAHVALEVSARLGDQVRRLHLVSAAAPIIDLDSLREMAGGDVFRLAMNRPVAFYLVTQGQRLIAHVAPGLLIKTMFASARGNDEALASQESFKHYITPIIRDCFRNRVKGYMRDVRHYAAWRSFGGCASSVHLWHGEEDNWSPLSMASYLLTAIPSAVHLESMVGLSHYSCLLTGVPEICSQLGSPSGRAKSGSKDSAATQL